MTPSPSQQRNEYPKPWQCTSGEHVLGQVVRLNGIRRLELFRYAIKPGQHSNVVAVLTGSADIVCSICNRTRTWHAPEEGINELIAKILDKTPKGV